MTASCPESGEVRVSRRNLLGGLVAVAAMPSVFADGKIAGTLKFCAFADIHYCPGSFPHDNRAWLERILDRARREKCDMVIHLGDLCHDVTACREYVDFYNDYPIPCYHTVGNHDDDGTTHEETLKAYRLDRGYYHFDRGGFRFVVMDTNYFERDGAFVHYSKSNYHLFWESDKKDDIVRHKMSDTRVPPEQLAWLRELLETSPHPCVITSHASFERTCGACPDGPAVRAIVNEANAAHPGRVRLVINGHHHCDHVRILDNVVYLDLNSASYEWMDKPHDRYPADYSKRWRMSRHMVMWDDPISAIITLSQDGLLRVEGQTSRFHLGISPEDAGYPPEDRCGRLVTPNIRSFEFSSGTGSLTFA